MNTAQKFPWVWLSFAIIFVMLTTLTGCEGTDIMIRATLTPTPTASPIPKVTCMPDPGGFYMAPESTLGAETQTTAALADEIYSQFSYAHQVSASKAPAKSRALDLLAYETWRWSQIETIKVDDGSTLRLVMTFISPELVRAAVLNHAIYSSYPAPIGNLAELTKKVLENLDKKNELLFIVIVQPKATGESPTGIEILPENITLRNTSDLRVAKTKSDSLTPRNYNFSSPLQAGFVIFPAGVLADRGRCDQVLGAQRDTSISLEMNGIKIGNAQPRDVIWKVPFSGALGVISTKPTPKPDFNIDDSVYTPLNDIQGLDIPDVSAKNHADQYQFWLIYARFVWSKLTLDYVGQ